MIDTQLDDVRKLLSIMGGKVEEALEKALSGWKTRNLDDFKKVMKVEEEINQSHLDIDAACIRFLAKQGPLAKDLRKLFSYIKMNADLERMGDQCVNIAHTGRDHLAQNHFPALPLEIEEMTTQVRSMVKWSLDAVVTEDIEVAKKVLLADDEVDWRKSKVFQDMAQKIDQRAVPVMAALDFILIARNLERLGDHATNIAEDVIFVSTGKDVRHGGKSQL